MYRTRFRATLLIVLVLAVTAGVSGLSTSSHYSAYFDPTDAAWLEHVRMQVSFDRGDTAVVLLEAEGATFLGPELWFLLEDLSDELRALPWVNRVVAASELGIGGVIETDVGQLIPDRDALEQHGRVFGLLLSEDARLAAVVVDVDLARHDADYVSGVANTIRHAVDRLTEHYPVAATYTGTLAMSAAYINVVQSDLRVIMPMLLLTVIILLGVCLGGVRAVAAVLPIGVLAVVAAFGIAGWLSATLAAINTFAPIMILSIAIAGCVHLVLAYQQMRLDGSPPDHAAWLARRKVLLPMSIANATTLLGFLALLLSPSPPLRIVGYTVAAGIAVSWLACIMLLPGLLARLDPKQSRAQSFAKPLGRMAKRAGDHRRLILIVAAGVAIAGTFFVQQNRVSDSVLDYFPADHSFSVATRAADEELAGVNEVVYAIDAGTRDRLFSESTVRSLASYVDWLRSQPEVRRVSSVLDTDVMRSAIADDRLAPLLRRLREQDARPLERRELSADGRRVLVAVYLDRLDSRAIVDFDARARARASTVFPEFDVTAGGASLVFAELGENNIRSMLLALSLGLFVAALVFGTILRSFRVAMIGLACNVLPVLAVYGVWAVVDGRISIGAATVMGMILGIVIDDTVYLLTAWWREREHAGAIVRAVSSVGPALVTTSLVLAFGLAAGLLSDFLPVYSMSALSVAIIITALLVDLIALPAMLRREPVRA